MPTVTRAGGSVARFEMRGLFSLVVAAAFSRRENAATTTSEANPLRPNRAMQPPARVTVGKNVGLHVTWYVYRGKGKVTFSPDQVMAWEDTRAGANSPWAPVWAPPELPADGKVVVHATFSKPGTYVLRGLADDGALFGSDEVTVTVRP